jgi:three-Cys-motif partner protein
MDSGRRQVEALRARTAAFGERAIVRRGDCNRDLLPSMREMIDPRYPCLCLLDPEGMEVDWATIEALSTFRTGKYKAELLLLLQVDGLGRVAPLYTVEHWAEPRLRRFWGPGDWRSVYERRRSGELRVDEARTEYVRLYSDGLRDLGYKRVLNREIRRRGRLGGIEYFLVFATDNKAGEDIMEWCFGNIFPREVQGFLPGFEPPTSRRV